MVDRRLGRRTLLEVAGSAGATLGLAGCAINPSDDERDGPGGEDGPGGDDEPGGDGGTGTDDGPGDSTAGDSGSLGEESWPQYQFDRGDTGYAPDNAGPAADPSSRWSATTGAPVGTSPVRANGAVYVGGGNGLVYALDEGDGTELWTFDAGSSLRTPAVVGGGADGSSGSSGGTVYANDRRRLRARHRCRRRHEAVGVPRRGPPPAADGSPRDRLRRRRAGDGLRPVADRRQREVALPHRRADNGPLAAAEDRLVAGTESGGTGPVPASGTLWTLTPAGELAWYEAGVDAAVVGVATRDGPAVATDEEGTLYGFRTKYAGDPGLLWSIGLAGTGTPMPATTDDTSYVSRGQSVTAVDVSDGTIQWEAAPGGALGTAPAVVSGTAYVGHESGLYALDVGSGSLEWGLDVGGAMGSPAVANGTVAVGSVIRASPCSTGSKEAGRVGREVMRSGRKWLVVFATVGTGWSVSCSSRR